MTRLLRAHARAHAFVKHAIGRRKPAVHGPAFRAAALLTGLAAAATTLAVTTARAAAEKAPARRSAPVRAVLARTASPAPGRGAAASPAPPSLRSILTGPATGRNRDRAPLLPAAHPATAHPATAHPAAADAPAVLPEGIPESRRVEHGFAGDVLRAHGIRWRSTGECSDRNVRTCTSFEQIRWGTIKGLVGFRNSSGCDIVVTGGTERGHASGPRSHWNGYKADIAPNRCVDGAVERYPFTGVRGDGARLYRSPDGVLFAREKDHWDITCP
ncbi:MAG: hypothetical protein FWJ90_03410 [Actinomadura sp.]